jgi:GNAT superfamily N-acetyltransferase
MDDTTLARLEHENMIEAMGAAGGQAPGALVRRQDGIALILTGLPLRLFNQVMVAGDDVRAEAIEAAVSVARERGDRFVVNLRAGTDDEHLQAIESMGLVPLSPEPWMPGMALHPVPGVGGTPAPAEWLEAVMSEALLEVPGAAVYVGYTDGIPVTTGLGVRTGRTMGVYNIATVETARGRGYGAAMTMRIVDDGTAAGCDVAILQASDMGKPIYERLGFRTVVDYVGYVDPATLTPLDAA